MRSRRGRPRPSRAMAARPERPLAVLHVWCERLGRLTQPRLRAIAQRARLHARRVSAIAHHAIRPSDDARSAWAAPGVPHRGRAARAPSGGAPRVERAARPPDATVLDRVRGLKMEVVECGNKPLIITIVQENKVNL